MPKADIGAIANRFLPAIWADPDIVPYAARVSVRGCRFIWPVSAFETAYRPGFGYPDDLRIVLLLAPLVDVPWISALIPMNAKDRSTIFRVNNSCRIVDSWSRNSVRPGADDISLDPQRSYPGRLRAVRRIARRERNAA